MLFMHIKWGGAGWRCFVQDWNQRLWGRAESEQNSGKAALYPSLWYSSRDAKSSWQLRAWLTSLCSCHEQTRKVMHLPGTKCHDCTFEKGLRCSHWTTNKQKYQTRQETSENWLTPKWNKKVWPWYENAFVLKDTPECSVPGLGHLRWHP